MLDTALGADAIEWLGTIYKTILPTTVTGGAMSILDTVSPARSGPPRHIHHAEDETFVVLTGEMRVWMAGNSLAPGPGQGAFIPRGTEHTFKVIGERPSRHLVILTSGGLEGFFSDMAKGKFRIPADMPAIEESAARHHLSFTGPPL